MSNKTMFSKAVIVSCIALMSLAIGCGHSDSGNVEYAVSSKGDSAQRNYEKGMKALEAQEWLSASKYFQYIRSRAQSSRYVVLAELRLADAQFGAEEYLEAVDSYKVFAKFHPSHELVLNGYVSFRIGEAYAKQLSDESWLFPPSYEKDQTGIEDAADELRVFVKKYPSSPFIDRARKIIGDVSKRLADHEWYVARYYWDRNHPMGTVLRLRKLIDTYPGLGYDEEALWLLGRAYVAVEMPDRARVTWTSLAEKFPSHARASDARDAVQRLPPPRPQGAAPGVDSAPSASPSAPSLTK
jgi:outer membrane protein assembly factor BamD